MILSWEPQMRDKISDRKRRWKYPSKVKIESEYATAHNAYVIFDTADNESVSAIVKGWSDIAQVEVHPVKKL